MSRITYTGGQIVSTSKCHLGGADLKCFSSNMLFAMATMLGPVLTFSGADFKIHFRVLTTTEFHTIVPEHGPVLKGLLQEITIDYYGFL